MKQIKRALMISCDLISVMMRFAFLNVLKMLPLLETFSEFSHFHENANLQLSEEKLK